MIDARSRRRQGGRQPSTYVRMANFSSNRPTAAMRRSDRDGMMKSRFAMSHPPGHRGYSVAVRDFKRIIARRSRRS
jgi:hypothetical protein